MGLRKSEKKPPFFISIEEGTPTIRWRTLIIWFLVVVATHVLTFVGMKWFVASGRGFFSQFGFVLFTFTGTLLIGLYLQYRRCVAAYEKKPSKQFSLLMLFLAMTLVATWIAIARLEHRSQREYYRQRQTLEEEAAEIIENGRVRFSGNQNVLMVVVNRRTFDDNDLTTLLSLIQSRLNGNGGVKHLFLSNTAVTDASAPVLAECRFLRYLMLDGNSITDDSLDDLAKIDSLEIISLFQTQVTQEGLDRFRRQRPNVDISPKNIPATNN